MFISLILIIIGIFALMHSADYLVKGSASISRKLGISPIVIGLTVVAFGTSAPELVVNLTSAFTGNTDIAIGNIIGSNIGNILLILGLTTLITNLKVAHNTTWREIPFALLAVLITLILGNDIYFNKGLTNILSLGDGLIMISFFIIFLYYIYGLYSDTKGHEGVEDVEIFPMKKSILFVLFGLIGLFVGGKILVQGAVDIAVLLGMSQMVIGLTVVAIGTSLPELVTSIVAAKKGHNDIAIGNIIGSNIFNIFWILGITSVIAPLPISNFALADIIFCVFTTILLFISIFVGKKHEIERSQGIIFLMLYIGYTLYLIMR